MNGPAVQLWRACEFVHQTRLAHPRLAHQSDELTAAGAGAVGSGQKRFELTPAPRERRQLVRGARFPPRSQWGPPGQLVHLDLLPQSFDRNGTQGSRLDIAIGQRSNRLGNPYGSRLGNLFHLNRRQ